ncbi:MAG: hypothetical protein FWC27_05745, partial [Firmicutes bacterium]|nr:hypothetical protein [Bacillota bacterium]
YEPVLMRGAGKYVPPEPPTTEPPTTEPPTTEPPTTEPPTTEPPTTEPTTLAPLITVNTGNWVSSGNFVSQVQNNSYLNIPGSVVETGVLYSKDSAMNLNVQKAMGPAGSPFTLWATGLSNGIWYYRAYVKTDSGDYYYGQIKSASYP